MRRINKITNILFVIYIIILFEIIVFKLEVPFSNMGHLRSINLVPYKESLIINGAIDFSEIFKNILIFIPLGIYLEMLFREWTFAKKVMVIMGVTFACEISQFIMGIGATDITDIINNTVGGIIGLLAIKLLIRVFKNNKDRVYMFVNIVATVVTVCMVTLLSLLIFLNL